MNATSDNTNETEPIKKSDGKTPDVEPATEQTPEPVADEAAPVAKRRFTDRFAGTGERLRGTRGLIAATLAALIIGGFGGAAIHAALDGHHRDGDRGRGEFQRGDRMGGPRDFGRAPGGVPNQLPEQLPDQSPSEAPSQSSAS